MGVRCQSDYQQAGKDPYCHQTDMIIPHADTSAPTPAALEDPTP